MNPESSSQTEFPSELRGLLRGLRGRIRRYLFLQGSAKILIACGLLFWGLLCLDWFFEPSRPWRMLGLISGGLWLFWTLYRHLLCRLFIPLSDRGLALLIERRFPSFEDALITAVELSTPQREHSLLTHQMLGHTVRDASQHAEEIKLKQVFDPRPLRKAVFSSLILVGSVVLFGVLAPGALELGTQRLLGMSDEPWPRRTHLAIVGFKNGEVVIARGSDLTIQVQADARYEIPRSVQLRYETEEGTGNRVTMIREGSARPGVDPVQEFQYTFQGVLSNRTFDVFGGDARLRNLRIRVVDSPNLIGIRLSCEFPKYLDRTPRDFNVSGIMQLPQGTRITVHARANKELVRAKIDYPDGSNSFHSEHVESFADGSGNREFSFVFPSLDMDTTLNFFLLDTDGIENREPVRLSLAVIPDVPPEVLVRVKGIGSAVTPMARIPWLGTIQDDYAVAETFLEWLVDDGMPQRKPLVALEKPGEKIEVDTAFEVEPLGLRPGQKLLLETLARDLRNLPGFAEANEGHGERFLLDVVTPDQLRVLLESRELNLRQRYETLLNQVLENRDSLARLEIVEEGTASDPVPTTPPSDKESNSNEAEAKSNETQPNTSPERRLSRNELRVQRSLQETQKQALELLGVAEAFDEIREELVNNRVDTEELRIRLQDMIADPLRKIAGEEFPRLEAMTRELNTQLNQSGGVVARDGAVAQADRIVVEMQKIRDKMLELESFNEAVEMLRQILATQQELTEKTKKMRLKKAKSLLEEE